MMRQLLRRAAARWPEESPDPHREQCAVVGVYGVMAQGVVQRAREFGVRQALGATPSDILRLVLSNGLAIGAVGVVTALALAFVSTRWMASLLYHVKPIDPWTFGAGCFRRGRGIVPSGATSGSIRWWPCDTSDPNRENLAEPSRTR